ncbi:carboxypeptidase-like regulatory domain-containing protein [Polaribacter haliotis]|uniref:Carboxypeptidase-like regulatory domain-containing protein n=1 Tax=Polaribacter haliotis TaxID=1888915 RepID=A0A7L8AI63_9FLAO|nr:carboxypeptidase-like regulatory domain-containing protein [Polaribacter haliotis]QOD61479.1 carboxypeptidase-like regulatory domain-containing protein [Polaribacter haliotis]
MKNKLLLIILFIPFVLFSQSEISNNLKTISGFINYKNKTLPGAQVKVKNTNRNTKTNFKGFYKIKAKAGETLIFNYIGLEEKTILIEDVTSTLNIDLKIKNDIPKLNINKDLKLSGSTIGGLQREFEVITFDVKYINKYAPTITEAILEKVPFFFTKQNKFGENLIYLKGKELQGPVLWEIDGIGYDIPFPIFMYEIKTILILNPKGSSCVIKVGTNINYNKVKDLDYNNYYFSNEDYYNYDAIPYENQKIYEPEYLDGFKNISNPNEALKTYINQYSENKNKINYHFNVLNYFQKNYKDKNILLKVLSDYEKIVTHNPEDLKGIAYKYQELNENKKALALYRKIANIRPNYAQSYRDLANSFYDLKNYKNFWFIYNNYFNKGFKIEDNDIGDIITSEIISNYKNDEKNNHKYQRIKINNPTKITEADVRLVFEWNTSEAEFLLDFVNPYLLTYKAENSIEEYNQLILDQKKKGYTSKEVIIENLMKGDWFVNFTYLGNKHYKPTILKVTSYYNWGKPNQTKKINVFEFTVENVKTQLLKLEGK